MFRNISWGNYCIAIGVLILVWYTFLGVRFYYKELKQIVSGNLNIKSPALRGNRSKPFRFETNEEDIPESLSSSELLSTLEDAEVLSDQLINGISESSQMSLSKEALQNCLILLLDAYPNVKNSTLRKTINELMVSECAKHPQMILTYAEVDGLWDEII
ncbi:MAG TPA: hypothetical protein VFS71_16870 [Flavobacterium sp.]|uniref:hypothetical protein n=1 Tax=Flavobacterium sp. TaxID=239 RepID=UPI002DBDC695|nr:hypothetical protein [Flavobacterium sp.]HEU4791363.1 hypothetical protein [Flavobacterium sp.]